MNTKSDLRQGHSVAGFISVGLSVLALLFCRWILLISFDHSYFLIFVDEIVKSVLFLFLFSVLSIPFALFALIQKKKMRLFGVIGGAMALAIVSFSAFSIYNNVVTPQRVHAKGTSLSKPSIHGHFVFRPMFTIGSKRLRAGHIFCSKLDELDGSFLFTAMHLFGPSGGLPVDLAPEQIANQFRELHLGDVFRPWKTRKVRVTPIVLKPLSAKYSKLEFGDIFVFRGKEQKVCSPVPMSRRAPRKGEYVWMAAGVIGNRKRLFHRGVVASSKGGILYYYFDDKFKLRATSGAPLLNSNGEIVAVNFGGNSSDDGTYGIGFSIQRIRKAIYRKYKAK